MTASARDNGYLLPERTRLFHIGLPKTGTTMLQANAGKQRETLLEHGVRYPGDSGRINHRFEVAGFMGRPWGGRAAPSIQHWNRMMSIVETDDENRIWVSHEFASESSEQTARKFCEAMGERVHIVVTLRHYGSTLASIWQQHVKNGLRVDFKAWLEVVLGDSPQPPVTPSFPTRSDQGAIITRWAEIVGPENVTGIITDKARPTLITDGFEELLGLPRGLLTSVTMSGFSTNRSVSVEEAELLRELNVRFNASDHSRISYGRWVKAGVAGGLLRSRAPGADETGFALPDWAAERATARGTKYADQIETSGVRIIGDLDTLRVPAEGEASPTFERTVIPLDLAATAIMSVIDQAEAAAQRVSGRSARVVTSASGVQGELEAVAARARRLSEELRVLKSTGPAMSTVRASALLVEFAHRVWRRVRSRRRR